MEPSLVSVVIPTYNRAKTLNRTLGSVFKQTYRNFEVIVVDDGSTDQTVHNLEYHPHLTLTHKKNRGVSAARNTGLKHAKGALIAFLDSDDEWKPKKLERQAKFFEENPDAMICQTDETWIRNGKHLNPLKKHKKYSGWIFKECLALCIVSPSAVMMRRELIKEVGGQHAVPLLFDETLPACEDYDLWLRIAARFPIHLIKEKLVVKYGGHVDQLSRTIENLDKYRIQALQKILGVGAYCNTPLQPDQWQMAFEELKKKCEIYGNGRIKRGKIEEGKKYLNLPNVIANEAAYESARPLQKIPPTLPRLKPAQQPQSHSPALPR